MAEIKIKRRDPVTGSWQALEIAVPESVKEALTELQEQIDQIVLALADIGVDV